MSVADDGFDLNAALLRRSEKDMRAFLSALAARLEGALPGRVEVERKRDGLFSRTSHVARIAVRFEAAIFTISFGKTGLSATRAKLVREVVISTTPSPVPQWLKELQDEVAKLAEHAGSAGEVLHGFL
jgi:hypothetical protein